MDSLTTKRLSTLALVTALVISMSTASCPNPTKGQKTEQNEIEICVVVVTLYRWTTLPTTFVIFVSINNISRGTVFHVTEIDLNDTSKNDDFVDIFSPFRI